MTSRLRLVYRRAMHWQRVAMGVLPPKVAAGIDRRLPLVVRPMNGQRGRLEIARSIAEVVTFDRVVETGTYRGATTGVLADIFGGPVRSVEAVPRYHAYAAHRLARDPRVVVEQGDSRGFLRHEAATSNAKETAFFYLDAHWEKDLPLAEELEVIASAWKRAVVMVDDFQVPTDPGYGFDDYGPGRALTEAYLPTAVSGWAKLYPTLPSADETGAKRGCVVLVSPAIGDVRVDGLSGSS